MDRIPDPRLGTASTELDPFDEVLISLVEAGCQYIRDHPEVRSEIRRHAADGLRRLVLKHLQDDDEGES
jgi:hypothetical protein